MKLVIALIMTFSGIQTVQAKERVEIARLCLASASYLELLAYAADSAGVANNMDQAEQLRTKALDEYQDEWDLFQIVAGPEAARIVDGLDDSQTGLAKQALICSLNDMCDNDIGTRVHTIVNRLRSACAADYRDES